MRELTQKELELISGGYNSSEDIVVTGSPYHPPYFPPYGGYPPPGYYPPSYPPPYGGGGGGSGPSVEVHKEYKDGTSKTTVAVHSPLSGGATVTGQFDLEKDSLKSITFDLADASHSAKMTFDLSSQTVGQSYTFNMPNGSATVTWSRSSNDTRIMGTLTYHF